MIKTILFLLFITSTAICQTGEWKYMDGWVYTSKTNDATAGGAIIQKKINKDKEAKYNTINGEKYLTTEEWKRITHYEEVSTPSCLIIMGPKGFFYLNKGPEPSAGGLFQLGLIICFCLNRFLRKI